MNTSQKLRNYSYIQNSQQLYYFIFTIPLSQNIDKPNQFSQTVHKSCASDSPNSCQRYLVIEQDGVVLKIGPGMEDITVQDNKVSSANLWIVSQRFKDFELRKKGNSIVFLSKKYHFDVFWDSVQDAKIVVRYHECRFKIIDYYHDLIFN